MIKSLLGSQLSHFLPRIFALLRAVANLVAKPVEASPDSHQSPRRWRTCAWSGMPTGAAALVAAPLTPILCAASLLNVKLARATWRPDGEYASAPLFWTGKLARQRLQGWCLRQQVNGAVLSVSDRRLCGTTTLSCFVGDSLPS